ncbi:isoprenylcysteine carboxylmethyltransferase family protein, partial [Mesorhizobium sp. M2E.F.Ca.ET.209.01.1.1]
MVDEVKIPADNHNKGLGGYQYMRRIVLAVLVVVLFAALLFGQSTFPPDTPV